MKALFILNSLANIGGVERMLVDKANHLADNGWDIMFLTYEQGENPILYELHAFVRHVDLDCRYYTLYRYPLVKRLWRYLHQKWIFRHRLRDVIQKHHTQLVITTTYCGEFLGDILAVCHPDVRTVVESHTAYAHDMIPNRWIDRLTLFLKIRNIRRFDFLIALTESDAKAWRSQRVRVKVVPNHVAYYPKALPVASREVGRILAVGRLHPQKRFDRLIDAFALIAQKYPQWHIDIFGRGAEKYTLLQQVNALHLEKRVFIYDPVDDISSEYKRSQFLVLSSDYEGFGLVIAEAMACGTPVVSTNCPFGPAEIIEDGVTGLLCELNAQHLASKIEWMITHDDEREAMRCAAYQSAATYQKEHVLSLWQSVYKNIII